MELSKRIIAFRAKYGLTQGEFASLCNVSRQTVHNVENGYEKMTKVTRTKIELVLGGQSVEVKCKQD